MKLKKVMALTMAGAMAATTLTACGSSSSTTETTKAAETTAAAAAAPSGDAQKLTMARWQSRSTRIPSLVISLP